MKKSYIFIIVILISVLVFSLWQTIYAANDADSATADDITAGGGDNKISLAYAYTVNGVAYEITGDTGNEEITIIGCLGYIGKLIIPETIEDKPVKYIKESAFSNNETITSVKIPDSVVGIGEEAFGNCRELRKVVLPAGLERIERATFIKCDMLSTIVLPETLKYIDDFAFEGCTRLALVKIPASLEYIGYDVFLACESLLLDCSDNAAAAEYAKLYSIETDFKSSWNYVLFKVSALTLVIGAAVFAVIKLTGAVYKSKKNKKAKQTNL